MSNKRAKARALKQKKERNKKLGIIACIALVLAVIVGIGLYALDAQNKNYIITFEGERVHTDFFRLNIVNAMLGAPGDARAEALEKVVEMMVLKSRAEAAGIELTEDDNQNMLEYAHNLHELYSQYGIDLTFAPVWRLAEIMKTELYYERLFDVHTEGFVPDEAAFAADFADFKLNNELEYADIQIKYAYVRNEDFEAFLDDLDDLYAGITPFDDFIVKHHVAYDPEVGINTAPLWELPLDETVQQSIAALPEGGFSQVVPIVMMEGNDFVSYNVIAQFISKTVPPDDELEAAYRERYIFDKRVEMFEAILQAWLEEAEYILNQRAYDAV